MDVQTGLIILGEFALLGAVIWAYRYEKALIAVEKHLAKRTRAARRRRNHLKELRRREKINRRAVYTPMKPPKNSAGEIAA